MRRIRFRTALIGAALLALAGCGGGGGGGTTTSVSSAPPPTETTAPQTTATTPTATATQPTTTTPTPTSTSPENQPGGAGDETPISTQALFTGKGGDITPATIHVPPFIAVRLVLRAADDGSYAVRVDGHSLQVQGSGATTSTLLPGLRAGRRYAVEVVGAPERLSIVANAEPGP